MSKTEFYCYKCSNSLRTRESYDKTEQRLCDDVYCSILLYVYLPITRRFKHMFRATLKRNVFCFHFLKNIIHFLKFF